jgi:flagellar operon protein
MVDRVSGVGVGSAGSAVGQGQAAEQAGFAQELRAAFEREGIHFSKHAAQRLEARAIAISEDTVQRLERGAARAAEKGARASLVLVDDLAFIVNVRARTVITAVDGAHRQGNVFTNIDSAVLA